MLEDNIDYTQSEGKPSTAFTNFFDILESFIYALAAVVIVFLLFGRLSVVDGQSMDNTLSHGEYLVVGNFMFSYSPDNGDIVVIDGGKSFSQYDEPIVKRVIATEGQTLKIDFKNELTYIDGVLIEEDYAKYDLGTFSKRDDDTYRYHNSLYMSNNLFGGSEYYDISTGIYTVTIPENHVFVMGDNRLNSADSRVKEIGFVHEDFIVGKAIFRLFPFSSMGGLY